MDILKDKIKPLYLKYLVAASGSAMVSSIFAMIDAMMVGKYHGPSGNAALAVFNPLWSIISMIVSLARGAVVSGAIIILLPIIAGANNIWYSMLITEIVVAIYSTIYMVRSVKTI